MPSDCCCRCCYRVLLLRTDGRLACQCPSVAEETLWEVLNLSFCLPSQPSLRGCVLGTSSACDCSSPLGCYENTEGWEGAKPCAGSRVAACTTLRRWRGEQRLLWLIHSQDPARSGGGPANCSSAYCHGMGQIKNEILLCPLKWGAVFGLGSGYWEIGFCFLLRKSRPPGRKGVESQFSGLLCLVRWVPGPEPEKMLQSSEPTRL